MALKLKFAAKSDVGRVRKKNDDSAYAGEYLAVLADGMGGHVGGDVASASTVLDLVHLDHEATADPQNALPDEIQAANLVLNELVGANPKLSGMGTTVTSLLLSGDTLHMAHIGDSRAYRLKHGEFEQISKDHTFVQRLVDEGRIKPAEAEVHPHKNVLLRVLGDSDASPELDVERFTAEPGERWMLCSDGLTDAVPVPVIEQIIRTTADMDEAVNDLVAITLKNGAPDNVTVVMFEVIENSALDGEAPAEPEPAPDTGQLTIAAEGDVEASASLLRHEISQRPHLLVGAAQLATQTGQIPVVTQHTGERRAAALLTHRSPAAGEVLDPLEAPVQHRRWLMPILLTLTAFLVVALAVWGYMWTQTQYFVGAVDGKVAIYKGVPQELGPISLSEVDTVSKVPLEALPEYSRQRVESTISAENQQHAQMIIQELLVTAKQNCPVTVPGSSDSANQLELPAYCQEIMQ
ncbi:PP2C family protein-serine/threonine phosphatase [Glutamicibacter sp. PAEs-4]|uniref:PP2C family protein-serine/threonine phosphatase n=1 Tax=Glutamicibacter TaxID=1742989 RepID=UPI0005795C3A|nr:MULTISPECIES: PP2C family serine/threonine-protein phosphatase [Glutamicibacter]KWR69788.1 serine/threonine protein phosphatase [Arthrobacter sp. W1]MDV2978297.1 protein phosphatase 2C domain-containing protein [Actinomycetes bacterium ARC8]QEP05787.1 serine/threonine-protein phosphatase [Glutamicibacter sp. ZJUTW]